MLQQYVLGFAFDYFRNNVVLIQKTKPEWQAGLYNGIGGKIENGENSIDAMVREFEEETTVKTDASEWKYIVHLHNNRFSIDVYTTFIDIDECKTNTEEIVVIKNINDLHNLLCVSNLSWLIPMCLDYSVDGYLFHGKIK